MNIIELSPKPVANRVEWCLFCQEYKNHVSILTEYGQKSGVVGWSLECVWCLEYLYD